MTILLCDYHNDIKTGPERWNIVVCIGKSIQMIYSANIQLVVNLRKEWKKELTVSRFGKEYSKPKENCIQMF